MIGWLAGEVRFRTGAGAVVVDVGGVGYEVHVARDDYGPGDEARLFVHTVVRDDAITLFGFTAFEERELFELLIATPGVGPATALGALRTMSTAQLAEAIEGGDTTRIATIPGIGPKTASRIVLELKGKLVLQLAGSPAPPGRDAALSDALRALGYSSAEIRDAVAGVDPTEDEAAALREALHRLRPR
ncbi:MAG TPA: Holliday junction branch migration protein RuvA [Acidimicrobiales bacterium]|nr:Holliday junction branch migration protein RuvA [Acidimicrobiales bacterium]